MVHTLSGGQLRVPFLRGLSWVLFGFISLSVTEGGEGTLW